MQAGGVMVWAYLSDIASPPGHTWDYMQCNAC